MGSRDVLLEKINKKQAMEAELKEQMEILRTNNVDLTCALVDSEDYPRSDIDLYKVRTARQKISCLQNDLNSLVKEISTGLEEHFSGMKVSGEEQRNTTTTATAGQTTAEKQANPPPNKDPFAIITDVTDGSPAQAAGLVTNDEIIEFGTLTGKNFEELKQFANIAENKLNKSVPVLVKRRKDDNSPLYETVQLVPKKWSGRGYLGMAVKPL